MFIKSSDIKVYPTASRDQQIDNYSNLNLEQNIVGLVNNVTDFHTYIIEGLELGVNSSNYLTISKGKCVIGGYAINIENATDTNIPTVVETSSPLSITKQYYIYLVLNTTGSGVLKKINGIDNNNKYTGLDVKISDVAPSSYIPTDTQLYLGSVEYDSDNNTWVSIYDGESSLHGIKFYSNTVQIDLDTNSGLVKNSYSGNFNEWLIDEFVLDDGEIS